MRIVYRTITTLFLTSAAISYGCDLRGLPGVNSALKRVEDAERRSQDEIIEKSPLFHQLNRECADKRLEDFDLQRRELFETKYPLLSFYYRSKVGERDGLSQFRQIFDKTWTKTDNLSINPTVAFQKGNVRAIVQFGGVGDANWAVTCVIKEPGER